MNGNADKQGGFLSQLVGRYAEGGATEEELEIFFHLLQEGRLDAALLEAMNTAAGLQTTDPLDEALAADWPSTTMPATGKVRRLPRPARFAVAAILLLLLGTGAWWIIQKKQVSAPPTAQTTKPADIPAPATNRATITLGNGRQVYLDSAGTGALAQQGSAQVMKLANGQVAYKNAAGSLKHDEILYNTLTNPRGSQVISLTLADGTKVWLNAESSLRYPVAFTGPDRTVEITGEAYFEVAHNNKPFIVTKDQTRIQVLGTHFNINAYTDEKDLRVTLLEGKVKVEKDSSMLILNPGQQAVVTSQVHRAPNVDTADVMSWKNGRFAFRDADLPTVLRQLGRWYDIRVTYEGMIPHKEFNGRISRNLSLDHILQILTETHIHYTIEPDRHLTIRP